MPPKKTNKTAAAKKTSARNKSKTTTPAEAQPQTQTIPFPYDVSRKTVRDKLIKHLEEEVAKHHATTLRLKEAELRLEGGMDKEGGNGNEADGQGGLEQEGAGANAAGIAC
jgi:hypothetical protein